MTAEQIERLTEFVMAGATDTTMPVSFVAPNVMRLLEERKRLLKVVKTAQSVGEIRFRTCILSAQVADQLAEAIDFAESPTAPPPSPQATPRKE